MNITDRRGLKAEAKAALKNACYDPKRLILIHTGASVVLGLILALLDYLLECQIDGTGGLGGVGARSVLETVQSVLTIAQLAVVMFWQIGYVYVALKISRGEEAGIRDLFQGFRSFGPVLRMRLLTALLYGGMAIAGAYLASALFMFTPWADPVMAAYTEGSEEAILEAAATVALPLMLVSAAVLLILMAPLYYRLRQAEFALMEDPRAGAMAAIRKSREMMRGRRIALFKLDLSFWWFYVLETLTGFLVFGDVVLEMAGVALPWSETVSYYLSLALCYLCTLALYWWRGNEVRVTYARAYEALKPWEPEQREP